MFKQNFIALFSIPKDFNHIIILVGSIGRNNIKFNINKSIKYKYRIRLKLRVPSKLQ